MLVSLELSGVTCRHTVIQSKDCCRELFLNVPSDNLSLSLNTDVVGNDMLKLDEVGQTQRDKP